MLRVLLLLAVLPVGSSFAVSQTVQTSAVFARVKYLQHGINASEWFAQVYDKRGYTREHFQAWTTAEDIALTVHPHPTLSETVMECAEVFFGHATHTFTKKKIAE